MILHLSRMRRNVNRNVYNAGKNVSVTTVTKSVPSGDPTRRGIVAREDKEHDCVLTLRIRQIGKDNQR